METKMETNDPMSSTGEIPVILLSTACLRRRADYPRSEEQARDGASARAGPVSAGE